MSATWTAWAIACIIGWVIILPAVLLKIAYDTDRQERREIKLNRELAANAKAMEITARAEVAAAAADRTVNEIALWLQQGGTIKWR